MKTVLEQLDVTLYREYILETYSDGHQGKRPVIHRSQSVPAIRFDTVAKHSIEHAERCDYLPEQHYCRLYLTRRQIPFSCWSRLYFTDDYQLVIRHAAPQLDSERINKIHADARLLIPFYDTYGSLVAISGRALDASELRYVTIRFTDGKDKLVYGMDRVKSDQPLFVTEGPLDSLFFDNAVASGDANLMLAAKRVEHADTYLVFDNERRNKEIVTMMDNAIRAGHRVMLWPETIRGKDINEMILNGHTKEELTNMILTQSVSGLMAQAKFSFWKKV